MMRKKLRESECHKFGSEAIFLKYLQTYNIFYWFNWDKVHSDY